MNADRSLAPDPEAAVAFLELMRPGGPWVLTAITPDGPTDTETFFKADAAAPWILRQNADRNIYFMVAEATATLRKKATKQEVAQTFHLVADIDGITAAQLNGHAPPPTTIVESGGGLNLYWALAEPIHDTAEIEARNRWIAQQLHADHCWNCDRILRLPGTINWPNAKKKRSGRVPVLARCTQHHPDRIYDFDDFGRLEDVAGNGADRVDLGDELELLTLDTLPAAVRDKLNTTARRLIREGPGPREYRDDRSKAVWAVTCDLVRAGASDGEIAGILLNPELPIHAHVADQKAHGPRPYVARQIERAREHVKEEHAKTKTKANDESTANEQTELPPFDRSDPDRIDWARYVEHRPMAPAFMIEGIVPRDAITGVFGMDGLGKSLFGQQTMAIGADVFGHRVIERGKTLGWFCEESESILAYRQEAINQPLGVTFANLEAIGFEARARLGMDNLLVRIVNDIAEPTPVFWRLREYCLQQAIRTLWLDHILHIVAGDIMRPEIVTKMLGILAKLASDMGGAVIIAGHVARAEESQYLGSVMFSALVRSRMWLRKPKPEELVGRPPCDHPSLRMLELAKANHAALGQVMLQWRDGAFITADGAATVEERTSRERSAEGVFIRALRELDKRHRSVDLKGTYAAHHTMVDYGINEELTASELQDAMRRLIKSKRIKVGVAKRWLKSNRTPAVGLAFVEDAS